MAVYMRGNLFFGGGGATQTRLVERIGISSSQLGICGNSYGAALSYWRAGSLVQELASGTPTNGHHASSNTCYTNQNTLTRARQYS